jgi:acetyltransferase-like isoleucine patch superfamily enzyme
MTAKLDNVPKEIFDARRSARQKYQELFVGRAGWGPLLKYELIGLLARNRPGALGLWLRSRLYPALLGSCGQGVYFGVGVTLRHPHKIHLGNNVVLDDGCVLDAKGTSNRGIVIGDGVFLGRQSSLATKDGDILIEDGVNISFLSSVFSGSRVTLGRNTLVAAYCYIVGGGHELGDPAEAVVAQARPSRGIAIGPDGWIGTGVTVLDGVTIGRGVVVGANSVVRHDLEDFAVAAGTPAKVVRRREGEPQAR